VRNAFNTLKLLDHAAEMREFATRALIDAHVFDFLLLSLKRNAAFKRLNARDYFFIP
jgi:hypothetical protein